MEKVAEPSRRREMAVRAVARRRVSIALACRTFMVSETCYRYSAKLNDDNVQIADLLIGLTQAREAGASACVFFICVTSVGTTGTTKGYTAFTGGWN